MSRRLAYDLGGEPSSERQQQHVNMEITEDSVTSIHLDVRLINNLIQSVASIIGTSRSFVLAIFSYTHKGTSRSANALGVISWTTHCYLREQHYTSNMFL